MNHDRWFQIWILAGQNMVCLFFDNKSNQQSHTEVFWARTTNIYWVQCNFEGVQYTPFLFALCKHHKHLIGWKVPESLRMTQAGNKTWKLGIKPNCQDCVLDGNVPVSKERHPHSDATSHSDDYMNTISKMKMSRADDLCYFPFHPFTRLRFRTCVVTARTLFCLTAINEVVEANDLDFCTTIDISSVIPIWILVAQFNSVLARTSFPLLSEKAYYPSPSAIYAWPARLWNRPVRKQWNIWTTVSNKPLIGQKWNLHQNPCICLVEGGRMIQGRLWIPQYPVNHRIAEVACCTCREFLRFPSKLDRMATSPVRSCMKQRKYDCVSLKKFLNGGYLLRHVTPPSHAKLYAFSGVIFAEFHSEKDCIRSSQHFSASLRLARSDWIRSRNLNESLSTG